MSISVYIYIYKNCERKTTQGEYFTFRFRTNHRFWKKSKTVQVWEHLFLLELKRRPFWVCFIHGQLSSKKMSGTCLLQCYFCTKTLLLFVTWGFIDCLCWRLGLMGISVLMDQGHFGDGQKWLGRDTVIRVLEMTHWNDWPRNWKAGISTRSWRQCPTCACQGLFNGRNKRLSEAYVMTFGPPPCTNMLLL